MFISKFSGLSLGLLCRLLLPLRFGTLVPLTLVRLLCAKGALASGEKSSNIESRASLLLLFLPITPFIATTPQGLANLFLILLVLVGWLYIKGTVRLVLPAILALSTLSVHILAGIPAAIFLAFLYLVKNREMTAQKWLLAFGVGSLGIPGLFLALSFLQPHLVQVGLHNNLQEFLRGLFDLRGRYNFWLDLVYLAKFIIPIFLFILVLLGLHELKKEGQQKGAIPLVRDH
jgi:hypothetical protein